MLLNSEADYAIRIVSCLADSDNRLDAATIADSTGVTLRYSLKILNKLAQGNIVKSFKGSKGGYVLAKSPDEITLLQVIELICGPITFSRCTGSSGECTHPMGVCYFRETFDDVSRYMKTKLSEVTFERK